MTMQNVDHYLSFDQSNELGRGVKSTVFSGMYGSLEVAVKRINCVDTLDAERTKDDINKIYRETDIMHKIEKLRHPNIVGFYYTAVSDKHLYLALELCQYTLKDYAKDAQMQNNYPPLKVNISMANGLQYLHSQTVVHRDLKPENVFLVASGKLIQKVVLGDFGTSKCTLEDMFSFTGSSGTMGYIPQEFCEAMEKLTKNEDLNSKLSIKSDIFALGCLFYYTYTAGGHPFGSIFQRQSNIRNASLPSLEHVADCKHSCKQHLNDCMEPCKELLTKMLSHNPKERPNAIEIVTHPALWMPGKIVSFLKYSGDTAKNMYSNSPVSIGLLEVTNVIPNQDWINLLPSNWKKAIIGRGKLYRGKGSSVVSLLRAIRNVETHYDEYSEDAKTELGSFPDGHAQFWMKLCPKLLMHVHRFVTENVKSIPEEYQGAFQASAITAHISVSSRAIGPTEQQRNIDQASSPRSKLSSPGPLQMGFIKGIGNDKPTNSFPMAQISTLTLEKHRLKINRDVNETSEEESEDSDDRSRNCHSTSSSPVRKEQLVVYKPSSALPIPPSFREMAIGSPEDYSVYQQGYQLSQQQQYPMPSQRRPTTPYNRGMPSTQRGLYQMPPQTITTYPLQQGYGDPTMYYGQNAYQSPRPMSAPGQRPHQQKILRIADHSAASRTDPGSKDLSISVRTAGYGNPHMYYGQNASQRPRPTSAPGQAPQQHKRHLITILDPNTGEDISSKILDIGDHSAASSTPVTTENNCIPRHTYDNTPNTIDQIHKEVQQEAQGNVMMLRKKKLQHIGRRGPPGSTRSVDGTEGRNIDESRTSLQAVDRPIYTSEMKFPNKLEFTKGDDSLPMDEISEKLHELIVVNKTDNDAIFDWIETNVDEHTTKRPRFIRALMTAVFNSAIKGHKGKERVKPKYIKSRHDLLQKYLDHQRDSELQGLYALQALVTQLEHPPGVLQNMFVTLYDEDIISGDAFIQWETSSDEPAGKEDALKQVVKFLVQRSRRDQSLSLHPSSVVCRPSSVRRR